MKPVYSTCEMMKMVSWKEKIVNKDKINVVYRHITSSDTVAGVGTLDAGRNNYYPR